MKVPLVHPPGEVSAQFSATRARLGKTGKAARIISDPRVETLSLSP